MDQGSIASSSRLDAIPREGLARLSSGSIQCLERLAAHDPPALSEFGIVKQAAVLVALFQKQGDDGLSVLLTTRASTMRRQPSLTALPGGKVDPEDPSPIYTARREAFEEVALPLDHPSIHYLTTLEPVLTILPLNAHMKNHIIVIPVVCFISDPSILDHLERNPDEVDAIFTHPLRGIFDGRVDGKDAQDLVEIGGRWWPHEEEFHDRTGVTGTYRMHRFRTNHSPVKGLTSDVLINTATIAYGRPPTYGQYAERQPPFSTAIANVVAELPGVLEEDRLALLRGEVREVKVVEWGGINPGDSRWKSGETSLETS